MNVVVIGSNGSLGAAIIPILKDLGCRVISVGRSHHTKADSGINWEISEPIPVIMNVDLVLYLALDYSKIRRTNEFLRWNMKPLFELAQVMNYSGKVVLPLSHSGRFDARSRYGRLKFIQEEFAKENGFKTILVGWLDTPQNGGQGVQSILSILRLVKVGLLPDGGKQRIFLTSNSHLERGLIHILDGVDHVHAHEDKPVLLCELVYGPRPPAVASFGMLVKYCLSLSPMLYPVLPQKYIKVFDSARSLL
jgi:hypothetical protein